LYCDNIAIPRRGPEHINFIRFKELRTANVKLATELQRLRTEDFEQLSVEELEKIEDKEKARLQNIAKTKLQKQIEAQLCDICQQKPHNTMVFFGKAVPV